VRQYASSGGLRDMLTSEVSEVSSKHGNLGCIKVCSFGTKNCGLVGFSRPQALARRYNGMTLEVSVPQFEAAPCAAFGSTLAAVFSTQSLGETVYSPTQRDSSEQSKIRCAVAHDHVLLRQGLRRLLEDQPDMEVVAEAGNAAEALQRVFEQRPEVIIADAGMFECSAAQVETMVLQESPKSKILFLRGADSEVSAHAAPEATNWVMRETSVEELVEIVRTVHASGGMSREIPLREIPLNDRREWPVPELLPRKRVLTTREREVLKLLAEGRTVRSAAGVLGLSAKTVDAHKFNLMRKLGIHNKAELVMWAIQKKVVKLPAKY
jgi:DNA-binding NarL/FixJ family response regulator